MTIDENRLLEMVAQMPAFPASAYRIIELSNDLNCAPRDLVEVIEHDPILTLNILKLVNSAYFGLATEVTSVKHAVVYLGINTIKNAGLSIAAIGTLPKTANCGFDMERFWYHSLLTAAMTKTVSEAYSRDETERSSCFVSGLLHDVGKAVFAQFVPKEYESCLHRSREDVVPFYLIEAEEFGLDHAELGGRVAAQWDLPEELVLAIQNHHSLDNAAEAPLVEKALVVGNQLSRLAARESEDDIVELALLPPLVKDWIGCEIEELLPVKDKLEKECANARMYTSMGA